MLQLESSTYLPASPPYWDVITISKIYQVHMMVFENDNVVNDDEIIVTPFAQILATLKEVRNNLSSMLMRTGEVVRSSHLYKAESMSGSVCVGVQNR